MGTVPSTCAHFLQPEFATTTTMRTSSARHQECERSSCMITNHLPWFRFRNGQTWRMAHLPSFWLDWEIPPPQKQEARPANFGNSSVYVSQIEGDASWFHLLWVLRRSQPAAAKASCLRQTQLSGKCASVLQEKSSRGQSVVCSLFLKKRPRDPYCSCSLIEVVRKNSWTRQLVGWLACRCADVPKYQLITGFRPSWTSNASSREHREFLLYVWAVSHALLFVAQ